MPDAVDSVDNLVDVAKSNFETFTVSPSTRPESITLQLHADGAITIAEDATAEELRAALTVTARAYSHVRPLLLRLDGALDRVGAPERDGDTQLDTADRLELLLLRLGGRLQSIVQANTALLTTLREVRRLLSKAPKHHQVKRAIEVISDAVTPRYLGNGSIPAGVGTNLCEAIAAARATPTGAVDER